MPSIIAREIQRAGGNAERHNIQLEPTRPMVCAIVTPRRAAQLARSADNEQIETLMK